ncbi:hypothetical protein NE613_15210, partial [Mordavella massiliensis]|nr:hypothetical protein [Mordavella massiliensis]
KGATPSQSGEFGQTWSFRGTKSRNKVSVGEPAEGSLKKFNNFENGFFFLFWQEHESFYWARRQEMESPAGPALKCAVLLGL